jgi:hypothetical protein
MVTCDLRSGVGFCREKIPRIPDLDCQNLGHLVQPVTNNLRDHRYPSVLPHYNTKKQNKKSLTHSSNN